MLYPNPKLLAHPPEPGLPLSCLRLKLLKKGIDDFEYLHILQTRREAKARARGAKDPQAEAQAHMRALAATVVKDVGKFVLDTAALERTRTKVAEEIEAAR
jgi:hypothetical protein